MWTEYAAFRADEPIDWQRTQGSQQVWRVADAGERADQVAVNAPAPAAAWRAQVALCLEAIRAGAKVATPPGAP